MAHNISAPATDPEPPVVVASATKHLRAGQVVADRYEVRAQLGAGGMGAVYRVFDRLLSEEVALKVLRLDPPSATRSLDPFRHETRLARKISHPNVCRVFDLGVASGIVFLTMELLPGETLRTLIKRNTEPLSERLRLFEETARGLAAVHARGFLHRDLKPENVLVRADGTAVVADFGLALVSDESSASATIAGTPLYMSPEQLRGDVLDARSDVFALGLLGYELLTGKRPFDGGSQAAATAAWLRKPPARPVVAGLDPETASGLADLLLLAMAEDPANRWSSAATMADSIAELRAAAAGYPVTIGKARGLHESLPDKTTMSATNRGSTAQRQWVAARPTTGVVLIAVLASGLFDTMSADGNSHVMWALPSRLWRAGNSADDFSWSTRAPKSLPNRLALLGARRLGGESFAGVTALAIDEDGFLYAAGIFAGSVPSSAARRMSTWEWPSTYVTQLSSTGRQQWVRKYRSTHMSHRINAMAVGADGNLYAAGKFGIGANFGDMSTVEGFVGGADSYVASYTDSGYYRWSRRFADSGSDDATAIAVDALDDVTVVGHLGRAKHVDPLRPRRSMYLPQAMYVESLDESGEDRWPTRHKYDGGLGSSVAVGRNGCMYVAGTFFPSLDLGGQPLTTKQSAGFVACLGPEGEHRWSRQLGDKTGDDIKSIAVGADGNVYMTGSLFSSTKIPDPRAQRGREGVARDIYVASLTASGEDRWSYRIGGTGDDYGVAIAVSATGDILIAAVVVGTVTWNSTTFESGARESTIIALITPSGTLRDTIFLRGCRISSIAIAPGARSEAYAAGDFEGAIDSGTGPVASVGSYDGVLLKVAW